MIRPAPASWFEIITAREDTLPLVKALARAGCAEFEPLAGDVGERERDDARRLRFRELERRYSSVWRTNADHGAPAAGPLTPLPNGPAPGSAPAEPGALLAQALATLEHWATAAEPALAGRADALAELAELKRWQGLLALPALTPALCAALAGRPGSVTARLFSVEPGVAADAGPELLVTPLATADASYLLALGPPAALLHLADQVAARGGQALAVPGWLAAGDSAAALATHRRALEARADATNTRLAALAREADLTRSVAAATLASWCLENVPSARMRQALCSLTGWTADRAALARTVDTSGARALIRYGPPPPGLQSPLLLHNPWWVSPYEVFSRLLGMPERNAPDPSVVVALAFPLLFGYMFGDLGQGLLLAAGGLLLGRRWPLANLFIPGGLAAAACGVLFGSVFGLHGVVDARWVEPLAAPLLVLLVPLAGGALLLLAGLALSAIAARWRGELGRWLLDDGAATATYLGMLASPFHHSGLLLALGAALGGALATGLAARRAAAGLVALATTVEKTVQLLINTLSFVRVGAFAIAHAGLSAALGLLADAAGAADLLVVVLGNLFIIALEVLVVSVQTTRLLLFEFFIRFFAGSGRPFQPAPPPPADLPEDHHAR